MHMDYLKVLIKMYLLPTITVGSLGICAKIVMYDYLLNHLNMAMQLMEKITQIQLKLYKQIYSQTVKF